MTSRVLQFDTMIIKKYEDLGQIFLWQLIWHKNIEKNEQFFCQNVITFIYKKTIVTEMSRVLHP